MSLSAHVHRVPDLYRYQQEIMTQGYTVVPPGIACPDGLGDRLLEVLLSLVDHGPADLDLAAAQHFGEPGNPMGKQLFYLLAAHPVFVEAVMNPVLLQLARYLIREPLISGVSANFKGRGDASLPLHADQPVHPCPQSLMCSAVYNLTPISRSLGGTCFVPGSHHLMRQPVAGETIPDATSGLVSIEAPAGSLSIWHGNTWHGAHARAEPGIRVQLLVQWCSKWIRPQEAYRECLPDSVVDRAGEEFAELIGASVYFGWTKSGPKRARWAAFRDARARSVKEER